jgi:YVTN family beta-propeller protein
MQKILRKLSILLTLFLLTVIFSCSEVPKSGNYTPPQKPSLLIIDEANKILKSYDLTTKEIKTVSEVGKAANDIEVDGDYAYIVVSLDNKLLKINLLNLETEVLSFADGSNPYNIAIDTDRIYVTLSVSNQLSVISKANFSIITNINLKTPGYPEGVIFDSEKIYIATSDGFNSSYSNSRIEIYKKDNYAHLTNIELTIKNPQSLCIDGSSLYIACTGEYNGSGGVLKMNTQDYSISNLNSPATNAMYLIKVNDKLFVVESSLGGEGGIYIHNLGGASITHTLAGKSLKGMAYDNGYLFTSEGYYGSKTYKVNISSLSTEEEINAGGGDIAIYK